MKHLNQATAYIENSEKTTTDEKINSHFEMLFPYIANSEKTLNGQLVSGHNIRDVTNAANEFLLTKKIQATKDGTHLEWNKKTETFELNLSHLEKGNRNGKAVLAHHLIQSFSPDDNLSPEKIHEIGRKTMLEFTGGEYEFVIATHTDRNHIHNHILLNSTNTITGKSFPWKITKTKNGLNKDRTKEQFEKISDKHASKAGAKIIDKSPKNSHKKYTMWQTESIYKSKIKSRLDFLLEHSSNIADFKEKAAALYLDVDFSKKWATYKLLDYPQIKNTRGRNLSKSNPEKYNFEQIKNCLQENHLSFSVEDVINRYDEKETISKNEFDYEVKVESWQIDHVTSKGIYLNVDFGSVNHGQLFIGGYKVDALENGDYNLYVKHNDLFYFMNESNAQRNRYMNGETLVKQLSLYNGTVPLKKEPVMIELNEIISAINFLADHGVSDGKQMQQLENKLERSLHETQQKLTELDDRLVELNQVAKDYLLQHDSKELAVSSEYDLIQKEISSVKLSRSILNERFDEIVSDIEDYREIKTVAQTDEPSIDHPFIQ